MYVFLWSGSFLIMSTFTLEYILENTRQFIRHISSSALKMQYVRIELCSQNTQEAACQ